MHSDTTRVALPVHCDLLKEAKRHAESRETNVDTFGAYAIHLLNTASALGFHPQKTFLYRPDMPNEDSMLELPDVSDAGNMQTLHRKYLHVPLLHETYTETVSNAKKTGVTIHERMRRSIRFANFVIDHTPWDQFITFIHKGEEVKILDIDKPYQAS